MSAEAVCQRRGSGYAGGRCLVCAQKYSAGYYHSPRKQVGLERETLGHYRHKFEDYHED